MTKVELMYFLSLLYVHFVVVVCTSVNHSVYFPLSSCVLPNINTCTSHSHIFKDPSRLFYHFSNTSRVTTS
jgi:hypothetical protein